MNRLWQLLSVGFFFVSGFSNAADYNLIGSFVKTTPITKANVTSYDLFLEQQIISNVENLNSLQKKDLEPLSIRVEKQRLASLGYCGNPNCECNFGNCTCQDCHCTSNTKSIVLSGDEEIYDSESTPITFASYEVGQSNVVCDDNGCRLVNTSYSGSSNSCVNGSCTSTSRGGSSCSSGGCGRPVRTFFSNRQPVRRMVRMPFRLIRGVFGGCCN